MLEFRLLGPLEVVDDGRPIELRGAKQRALLAVLLLHANEVVSADRLIDDLWGEEPPEAGGAALRVRVSQLRKALGGGGRSIVTQPPGYCLRLERGHEVGRGLPRSGPSRCWRGYRGAAFGI